MILLTADGDRARVLEAAKPGARHYLPKSRFSLPGLLNRVKDCVVAVVPLPARRHRAVGGRVEGGAGFCL